MRSRTSPLLVAGFALIILVGLVLGGLAFLLFAAPTGVLRDQLVEEVRARTGRTLAIGGPVSLTLFPGAGVSLSGVVLSSPPGWGGEPVLKARTLTVELGLGALLSRRAEVRRVVLTEPEFNLVVDRNGRSNWDFALAEPRVRYAQARGTLRDTAAPGRAGVDLRPVLAALAELGPVEARIDAGRARYRDERTGEHLAIGDIEATAGYAPGGTASAKGSFTLRGQPLDVTARLDQPRGLLADGRAEIALRASGAPLSLSLDGTLTLPGGRPAFDGSVTFASRSAVSLAAWLGRPVPAGAATDLSLSSRLTLAGERLSLVNFTGSVAGKPARGSLVMELREPRPHLAGTIELGALDFATLLLRSPGDPGPTGVPTPVPAARPQARPVEPPRRADPAPPGAPPAPPPAGSVARHDWSSDRLDIYLLSLLDAEIAITAEELRHHRLHTGPSRVALNLSDRLLRIDLEDMLLYGGRGRGVAVVDAAQASPTLTVNLNLEGIEAGPFMEDAAGFGWLEGRINTTVALAGQGASEREVVETLSGTVDVKSGGGALRGIDIPKLVRAIETGEIPRLGIEPDDRTAFSDLGAQFVIANGIAQNKDLRLVTQHARLTGAGVVDLPRQHLDFELKARLSGSGTRAEGAIIALPNLELPLRVEGPWERPSLSLKGQDQIVDGLRQVGKVLRSPEVQDALKGLFGGSSEGRTKPRDLLEKLLKKE
ncbi:MAG: AsmA family protein [Hyphomicrobiaceae bacterium]|nr:AsmA family protein [Hyphomicrobiaceae bacterium]